MTRIIALRFSIEELSCVFFPKQWYTCAAAALSEGCSVKHATGRNTLFYFTRCTAPATMRVPGLTGKIFWPSGREFYFPRRRFFPGGHLGLDGFGDWDGSWGDLWAASSTMCRRFERSDPRRVSTNDLALVCQRCKGDELPSTRRSVHGRQAQPIAALHNPGLVFRCDRSRDQVMSRLPERRNKSL
jgi:hypothetical protein